MSQGSFSGAARDLPLAMGRFSQIGILWSPGCLGHCVEGASGVSGRVRDGTLLLDPAGRLRTWPLWPLIPQSRPEAFRLRQGSGLNCWRKRGHRGTVASETDTRPATSSHAAGSDLVAFLQPPSEGVVVNTAAACVPQRPALSASPPTSCPALRVSLPVSTFRCCWPPTCF